MTYENSPIIKSYQKQILYGTILGGSSIVNPTYGRNCYLAMRDNNLNWLSYKINELKEHLKKYTAPPRNKKYYENHRDEIIQKSKEYKEKTGNKKVVSSEKIKEYNKKAYEKRKLKKSPIQI